MPIEANRKAYSRFYPIRYMMPSPSQNKTAVNTHEKAISMAADFCRAFEGFRPRPYLCPAGVPTIGYGTTIYPDGKRVTLSDAGVTRAIASAYLNDDLSRLMPWVLVLCPGLSENRLAALLDFAYNLGVGRLRASTLLKKVNAGDWSAAKVEILKWNKAGGKILPGLVKRREAEARLL